MLGLALHLDCSRATCCVYLAFVGDNVFFIQRGRVGFVLLAVELSGEVLSLPVRSCRGMTQFSNGASDIVGNRRLPECIVELSLPRREAVSELHNFVIGLVGGCARIRLGAL